MFVMTKISPPLNSETMLTTILPPIRSMTPPLGLHSQGRVVRVETVRGRKSAAGFAVAGKRLIMRRGDE